MIVADAAQDYFLAGARGADVISYFWLDVERTAAAQAARRRDEEWVAPDLWRSEFRNVLYQHMEHRDLALSDALRIAARAEADLEERTYDRDDLHGLGHVVVVDPRGGRLREGQPVSLGAPLQEVDCAVNVETLALGPASRVT